MSVHCTVFLSISLITFLSLAEVSEESKRKRYFQGFLGRIYSGSGGSPREYERRERLPLCRMKTEEEGACAHAGCPRRGQRSPAEQGAGWGVGEDRKQQ